MTSQTAQQITAIQHSLLNKHATQHLNEEDEAMKFGKLIKYSVINIFLKKLCIKWDRGTGSRPPFLNRKLYVRQKQVVSSLVLIYFGSLQLGHTVKTNFVAFQTVNQGICSISSFYKKVWD